jgi:hypothetical protein
LGHVVERSAGVVEELGEVGSRVGTLEVTDDLDAVDLRELCQPRIWEVRRLGLTSTMIVRTAT